LWFSIALSFSMSRSSAMPVAKFTAPAVPVISRFSRADLSETAFLPNSKLTLMQNDPASATSVIVKLRLVHKTLDLRGVPTFVQMMSVGFGALQTCTCPVAACLRYLPSRTASPTMLPLSSESSSRSSLRWLSCFLNCLAKVLVSKVTKTSPT